MMSRYFVVVQIPQETVELVKSYYRSKFHREMSATHMHMSLLPPFFLDKNYSEVELLRLVSETKWDHFEAKFVGVRLSEQRLRKYLFLKVGSEESCRKLSLLVEKQIEHMMNIDKTPYLNEMVPPFEAHVTIDYDFGGEIPDDFPEILFNVEKISVAKEVGGEWVDLDK